MAATNYRDKRFRKVQGGPLTLTNVSSTSTNQWFGTQLISSRDQFVAAPLVAASSRFRLTPIWFGVPSLSVFPQTAVYSVQAGSGFILSTVGSVGFAAAGAASYAIQWEIVNPRA